MYGIGIMSGTSLDGIDTVLVKITGYSTETQLEVIAYNEYPLHKELVSKIKKACSLEHSHSDLICSLNFELGYSFCDAVKALLQKANFPLEKIDYIASHGQTIFHIPENKESLYRSTLQIGEAAILAYQFQTTVISNFRVMDMAAGGQGAPLVPYSEYILYSQSHKNRILQNIGGIGNLTFLNGSLNIDDIFAFDTGPGNMMINEACQILYNLPFDDHGQIAKQGKVISVLLDELILICKNFHLNQLVERILESSLLKIFYQDILSMKRQISSQLSQCSLPKALHFIIREIYLQSTLWMMLLLVVEGVIMIH